MVEIEGWVPGNRRGVRAVLLPPLLLLAAGCTVTPERHRLSYEPVVAPAVPKQVVINGSIYQAGRGNSLFEDDRARHLGDILTIKLAEKMDAKKKATTSSKKDDSVNLGLSNLLGPTGSGGPRGGLMGAVLGTNAAITSAKAFKGGGDSAQSNSLKGDISVTVIEVLPNRTLRVRGEKLVTINQGEEVIRLSGIVRVADITPQNTVLSTQIADAHIVYSGNGGTVANSNVQGWLGKFFMSPFWIF